MGSSILKYFWFQLFLASSLVVTLLGLSQYGIEIDYASVAIVSSEIINGIPAFLNYPFVISYGFYIGLFVTLLFLGLFVKEILVGRKRKSKQKSDDALETFTNVPAQVTMAGAGVSAHESITSTEIPAQKSFIETDIRPQETLQDTEISPQETFTDTDISSLVSISDTDFPDQGSTSDTDISALVSLPDTDDTDLDSISSSDDILAISESLTETAEHSLEPESFDTESKSSQDESTSDSTDIESEEIGDFEEEDEMSVSVNVS